MQYVFEQSPVSLKPHAMESVLVDSSLPAGGPVSIWVRELGVALNDHVEALCPLASTV